MALRNRELHARNDDDKELEVGINMANSIKHTIVLLL